MSNVSWKINAVFMPSGDSNVAAKIASSTASSSASYSSDSTINSGILTTTVESYHQHSATTDLFADINSSFALDNVTDSDVVAVGNQCLLYWTTDAYVTLILFCIIFCLSVVGNSTVIFVILKQSTMRSITNIFLLNLAVADLLLCIICIPPTLLNNLCFCWILGYLSCKLFAYLQPVSVAASAYTLAVIALERYNAICRPLRSRPWQTRSHAYKMIAFVWLIAFVSNIYSLFMYNLVELNPLQVPGRLACVPDRRKSFENFAFQIYLTVVLLLIPLCMMVVLYGFVIHSLRVSLKMDLGSVQRKSCCILEDQLDPNEIEMKDFERLSSCKRGSTFMNFRRRTFKSYISHRLLRPVSIKKSASVDRLRNSTREYGNGFQATTLRSTQSIKAILAKQRLIRMLVVIVILFFCCWTPNFIFWLIQAGADYFSVHLEFNARLHIALLILCYLSSCTNPITYCFLNKKFRTALLVSFGCRKAKPIYFPMIYLPNASPVISQASPNQTSEPHSNRTSINGNFAAAVN